MRDIKKRITEYSSIFNIQVDFEFSKWRRKNRHVLRLWYVEEDKKLNTDTELKVFENLVKEFLRLRYFHKIILINIFHEDLSNITRKGYLSMLSHRLKRYKGVLTCEDNDIVILA